MKKFHGLIFLMVVVLLCTMMTPAFAGTTTLTVDFYGMLPKDGGGYSSVQLDGTFEVVLNGAVAGTVNTGRHDVLTLSGAGSIVLRPVDPEANAAYDIHDEYLCTATANMANRVPIMVYATSDEAAHAIVPVQPAVDNPLDVPGVEPDDIDEDDAGAEYDGDADDDADLTDDNDDEVNESIPELTDVEEEETPSVLPEPNEFGSIDVGENVPAVLSDDEAEALPALTETGDTVVKVHVFVDGNFNGEWGKYERGKEGVDVRLIAVGSAGLMDAGTVVTDTDGVALFPNLPEGQYMAEVYLPSGYGYAKKGKGLKTSSIMEASAARRQRSEAFNANASAENLVEVGCMQTAKVTGTVWLDVNGDGIMNSDEPTMTGVHMELASKDDPNLVYTAYSDASGNYVIDQIQPGAYRLRCYCPDGMGFTKYSATGGAKRSILTSEGARAASKELKLAAGDVYDLQHVGLIESANIVGVCYLDANYNGFYDEGEQILTGVKLEISKPYADKPLSSIKNEPDGSYAFTGLRSGTYELRVVLPDTGVQFTQVVNGGNQFRARPGRREFTVDNINMNSKQTRTMDVGAITVGTITGTVYFDDDFSGGKNGKEKVTQGVSVKLWTEHGEEVSVVKSNAKGLFKFTDVAPGRYYITTTGRQGYAYTKVGTGNVMRNVGSGNGQSDVFDYAMGENLGGLDIGMILPGTVSGTFFADANDNGIRDAGENRLDGVQVSLVGEEGIWFTAEADQNGDFLFDAVMPGRYCLQYDLPEGAVMARTASGGNVIGGGSQSGQGEWFSFAMGANYQAPLAGGLTLGRIAGLCFADSNGNGVLDDGEQRLSGVSLTLNGSDPVQVTTGEDGTYVFSQIRPGTYTLDVQFNDGRVTTRTERLAFALEAGHESQQCTVAVPMGQCLDGQEIGAAYPASLSGVAWLDENNNGVMDAGEAAAAGSVIQVVNNATGSVFRSLTADEAGSFFLDSLIPGSYTLRFDLDQNTIAPQSGDCTFTQNGSALVQQIEAAEGSKVSGITLGVVRLNSISGNVWVDRSGRIKALKNAKVTLLDAAGQEMKTTASDENGDYRFDGLLPGTYTVAVKLPAGQLVVEPDDERLTDGSHRSVMTRTSGVNGKSDPIQLTMLGTYNGYDAGSVLPARLGDYVWLDVNGNGLQDSDEYGLSGLTIRLLRNGETVAETVTDQYGYWVMQDVYPAVYTLQIEAPADVKPTKTRHDFPNINSVLTAGSNGLYVTEDIAVTSDERCYDADMGFVPNSKGAYPKGYGPGATQKWK